MKQFIITFLLAMTLSYEGIAQTRPQQSMFNLNPSFLNPAATGIEDYGQFRMGLHRQWVGIDGAPATAWLNGEMRLRTDVDELSDSIVSKGHGIGFNLYYDKIGPYASVNLNVGYAYHLPLSQGLVLSAGFAGGLHRTQYDISKSVNPDQPVDPATAGQASLSKKYSPDLNAGLQLNGKNFFGGVSFMQIIPSRFIDAPKSESKYKGQLLGSLGYVFRFNDEATSLWLSGIVKSDFANPLRYDLNAKFWYRDLLWIGGTYRKNDALGAGLGLNFLKNISFSYLYEWGVSSYVSSYSKGSHVLSIGFKFLRDDQSGMPKMGW
ncbi:PorP/SprF family type IX secretion system membrane protein [Chitinophaga niabensis]|uniref:PorP/SprF family type IX secretion system membrane protein n=1 Tax=Chitinophaga niabensis TaxID=536979 RepID=UPI0031BB1797